MTPESSYPMTPPRGGSQFGTSFPVRSARFEEETTASQQLLWDDFEELPIPPATPAPFVMSEEERYAQGNRSKHNFIAYVVFAGRSVGVFYNWYVVDFTVIDPSYLLKINRPAVKRSTEDLVRTCFKGFKTYEAACLAWQEFVVGNVLPVDTLAKLNSHHQPPPIPPPVYEPSIAGKPPHRPQPPLLSPTRSASAGVTVHIHANVSNTPPYVLHSQSQPAPHSVQSPRPFNASPYSPTPARTPPAQCHGYTQTRPSSPTPSRAGPSASLRSPSVGVPPHHLYFVVLVGKTPGVYLGYGRATAALGPLTAAKYTTTSTKEEADALFVREYMVNGIARLSE
ncbi:hypothetical protein BJ912DRAFT_1068485 [Pholiota molesta]|nr:hypothetical protein BJ912DRAFT_1068485 [Pholiota molesta]